MKQLKKKMLLVFVLLLSAITALSGCSSSGAGGYPEKTIKIIVPWGAGGDTDVINRIAAKYLEEELGGKITIQNIGGGSGSIGAQEAIGAEPDGYTLLAGHDSIGISKLMGQTDFDYFALEPVSLLTSAPQLIATHVDNPWDSMQDVVDQLKQEPESISFGASIGSTSHMVPLGIQDAAGVKFNIVGYDGTAKRTQALLGKHLDFGATTIPAAQEYMKANQLKILGIATEKRTAALPDVPTLKEQGIDFTNATNRGIFAPKGTPEEIIKTLSDAIKKVAENPEFIKEMENMGVELRYMDHEKYSKHLQGDVDYLGGLLKRQGVID
ncbi:tripartite tricarboxylate transporter substrate binding protein [Alkalihalobacillus sp. AL-G]|uniref:tripartite tricarboxylate transporter substrate binding protein n=1 Tax=Alkalihalobacillus sp. AL-G TaxID=2926399 RepID=UPI00272A2181|nr:tripartite tricarboxylate transporter substrate binding protein [Alkalihalobacillus sp. AL-G]WLD93765.1 tripartite tricarboxylate transporter substrate binding protein [Alkalihalobacillus sp. AL-G]